MGYIKVLWLCSLRFYVYPLGIQPPQSQTNSQNCFHLHCDPTFVGGCEIHATKPPAQSQMHIPDHVLYLTYTPSQYFPGSVSIQGGIPDNQGQPLRFEAGARISQANPKPCLSQGSPSKGCGLRSPHSCFCSDQTWCFSTCSRVPPFLRKRWEILSTGLTSPCSLSHLCEWESHRF